MSSRLRLALFLVIVASFPPALPKSGFAQQSHYFGDSLHDIAVSESQDEKLYETEGRLNEEIHQLQDTLRTTQQKLRQQVYVRDNELEALLTAEQLKSLNEQRLSETRENAKRGVQFMAEFARFLDHVSASGELTVFEGLPRATDDELAKIKNDNKTIEIDGWYFYAQPLPTKPSTVEKLRSTLVNYQSFQPYSGGKFCGGFHPDFCVEWKTSGKTHNLLVCLTCFESVYITPTGKTRFDFNDAAWKSFTQIAVSAFIKHKDVIEKLDQKIGQ